MYRAEAIISEPGYHRVYGETTKHAQEASDFNSPTSSEA
jgi:hypothetical protein